MLSYRHAFHAGNFADVLKHLVQIEILLYLQKKEKPFIYIDTHAGAGAYSLDSMEANKTQEYRQGIERILLLDWPELSNYQDIVRTQKGEYPGSPVIAQRLLREQDHALLFELHPNDGVALQQRMARDKRIRVRLEDGLRGLIAALPTPTKRGLVLMDPSYEMKDDYDKVIDTLQQAHRRMATATYALWYPVVDRARIERMERSLKKSGNRNIQRYELGLQADAEGYGMTSAGMIVINPPWTLLPTMQQLLPRLAAHLSEQSVWRCDEWVAE